MRAPMERIYGIDNFPALWSAWVDGLRNIYERNNGDICKDEVRQVKANTLIVHGAKDPMIDKCHPPFLLDAIESSR